MASVPAALGQRLSQYFRHHVTAQIKLTPPPTNAKEARYLYRSFKSLGNVEYFSITRGKKGVNVYDCYVNVVYNPSEQRSLLESPFHQTNEEFAEYESDLKVEQSRIIEELDRIIALPRYSYIENDAKYEAGQVEVQFKHKLPIEALKYENRYTVTSSTVDSPFLQLEPQPGFTQTDDLRRKLRHNFQKFHKFDSIRCWKGDRTNRFNHHPKTNENENGVVDYSKLMVMESNRHEMSDSK